MARVQQHAALLAADAAQRDLELIAAVAAQRVEDVTGHALRVHAHEHVLGARDLAAHEREVQLAGQDLAERDRGELAVGGRQPHGRRTLDEVLLLPPVLDQVGDRDECEVVRRQNSIRSGTRAM